MAEPVMRVKQIQEKWKPRWKWFRPPHWFIFRWAYQIDINANVYKMDENVEVNVTIQQFGVKNKNGRIYSADVVMKQVSHGPANQVQIGIVNNYINNEEDEEEDN